MTLAEYLRTQGFTQQRFAALIGVSQVAVSKYINGKRMPKRELLARILEATEGQVAPNDFLIDKYNVAYVVPPVHRKLMSKAKA